jgi:hypothetical protein
MNSLLEVWCDVGNRLRHAAVGQPLAATVNLGDALLVKSGLAPPNSCFLRFDRP